jgi:TonB family protein
MKRPFELVSGAAIALLVLATGPAAWAQSPGLAPVGSWELQQDEESCSLVRSFGGEARELQLRIQSFGLNTPYHIVLTGDGLPLRDWRSEVVRIGFGGSEAADDILGLVGKPDGKPMIVVPGASPRPPNLLYRIITGTLVRLPAHIDPTAEVFYLDMEDMEPVTLQLGPMQMEFARLNGCLQTLADKWAAPVSGDRRPASEPELLNPDENDWRKKYPQNLLLNRISGLVELRMTVGENGRARDCVVQASIWHSRFGETACADFEKWARFKPASDASGNPIASPYRTAAIFAIYDR